MRVFVDHSSIRHLVLLCVLATALPCTAQMPGAVRGTAGCYALSVTEWSPPDINAAYHRIPSVIRLDTVRAAFNQGWVLAPNIAFPGHGTAFPGTPSWNIARDTLRLAWSNGFQVTVVKLIRADSGWTGEAVSLSDAHPIPEPPPPRAHVTAQRQMCPDTLR